MCRARPEASSRTRAAASAVSPQLRREQGSPCDRGAADRAVAVERLRDPVEVAGEVVVRGVHREVNFAGNRGGRPGCRSSLCSLESGLVEPGRLAALASRVRRADGEQRRGEQEHAAYKQGAVESLGQCVRRSVVLSEQVVRPRGSYGREDGQPERAAKLLGSIEQRGRETGLVRRHTVICSCHGGDEDGADAERDDEQPWQQVADERAADRDT